MELGRNRSKGQVFVIAAVLFSSLTVLLFMATTFSTDQTQDTVKDFYRNVFSEAPEKFNHALKENYSIENSRNNIYSYSRFADRSSSSKGIDFGASYLIVMPQKGESVFINYRDSPEDIKLYISGNGWTNTSVSSEQYLHTEYTSGKTDFEIIIPARDINQKFEAASPRIFTSMRLSAQNQIWINSELS